MKIRDQFYQTKIWGLISHHESVSRNIAGVSRRFRLGQLYIEAFVKHMLSSYVASLTLFKMHVGQKSQEQTQGFLADKSNGTIFEDPRSLITPNYGN